MNAAQEYLTSRVMTASPQALHLLVVEGALRKATRAEAAFAAGDREAADKALEEARAFVGELITGLDRDAAPEMVSNIAAIFVFAYRRLAEAGVYNSADKVRDAIKVLRVHRDTWSELLSSLNSSSQTAAPAAPTTAETISSTSTVPTPHLARRRLSGYEDYESRSWSG